MPVDLGRHQELAAEHPAVGFEADHLGCWNAAHGQCAHHVALPCEAGIKKDLMSRLLNPERDAFGLRLTVQRVLQSQQQSLR
jgi:hypothetical protein